MMMMMMMIMIIIIIISTIVIILYHIMKLPSRRGLATPPGRQDEFGVANDFKCRLLHVRIRGPCLYYIIM